MAGINPLQRPINYESDVQSPFQAALGGFKIGADIAQIQAQQAEADRKQKFATGLQTFFANPNRKYEDLEPVLAFADKQQFDALQAIGKNMGERKLDSSKAFFGQLLVANEYDPAKAQTMLETRIEAEQDPGQKEAFKSVLETLKVSPKKSGEMIEFLGGATFGKDWYDGITKVREERRTQQKFVPELSKAESEAKEAEVKAKFAEQLQQAGLNEKNWNVKNLQSQISNRAAALKLDVQRTQADVADKMSSIQSRLTTLPESAQKLVNESATNAATAKQASNQYTEMAKQLDGLGGSWGALNSLGEWSKSQFGSQDFRTAIQNEYTRLANSAGIKAYKAAGATGGFSDADLNTALAGIPKANANPQVMAQFMRGMAKEQAIAAALDNAKTDWLTQNKGQLGRASGTFLAGDYAVKPGETYADFSARVTKDVVKKFTTPAQSALVEQIPTDRNPAPMAEQQNIRSQADAILRGGR